MTNCTIMVGQRQHLPTGKLIQEANTLTMAPSTEVGHHPRIR